KGTVIFHPELEGKNIINIQDAEGNWIVQKMISDKNGSIQYLWKESDSKIREKYAYFHYLPEMDWYVVISSYKDEFFDIVEVVQKVIFISFFVSLMLLILIVYFSTKSLKGLINQFQEVLIKASKGFLNERFNLPSVKCSDIMKCSHSECNEYVKDKNICFINAGSYAPDFGKEIQCPRIIQGVYKDCKECKVYKKICKNEIYMIAAWFNKFMALMSSSIQGLKKNLVQLSSHSQTLFSHAQENAASIEEISVSANSVVNKAVVQKDDTAENKSNIQKIYETIHQLFEKTEKTKDEISNSTSAIEQMAANISSAAGMSVNADQASAHLLSVSEEGSSLIHKLSDSIQEVAHNSEKITEMVQLIMDISEQTNLLAMNAAIEAAHAGDYGKGFAVVAEEIRKLADKSAGSAKEIQGVVKSISQSIQNNLNHSDKTKAGFVLLKKEAEKLRQINKEIASSMEEQNTANQEVLKSSSNINDLVQNMLSDFESEKNLIQLVESKGGDLYLMSEDITVAIEEEEKALEGMALSLEELSKIANDLKQIVDETDANFKFFKIEE
ncbi:MAG TPA: hypothetical protein DHW82_12275, partial [Spirochaetia bacterium]|nr:hypothetical protein [Spirochaetia bacterium]